MSIDRVARITVSDGSREHAIPATVKESDTEETVRAHMARYHPEYPVVSVAFGYAGPAYSRRRRDVDGGPPPSMT